MNRLIGVVRDLEDLTDALVSLRDAVRRARLRFPRTFLIVTVKVEVLVILGLISVIT